MATIYDRLLLAKTEVTKGSDPTPTAGANAIRVVSFNFSPNISAVDRPVVKQTMGMLEQVIDPDATVQIDITVDLTGSGTAGTAPETSPLFQACRMVETATGGGTTTTYLPSTGTEKSCTIYGYKDGMLWKALGAVGTFTISANQGEKLTATFTMSAKYVAPAVASVPSGASYKTTQAIVCSSSDVVSEAGAIAVGAFSIDMGNDVQQHRTTQENSFVVANRAPTLTITKDSVATAAEWTALLAGSNLALSSTFGSATGNKVSFNSATPVNGIGGAQRQSIAYSERAERDTLDVTYGLYEGASDDQLAIVFA